MHELVQAALVDGRLRVAGTNCQHLLIALEVIEVGALDAADGTAETQVHHLVRQADDLEQLPAAVACDRRDAHLGHDLEQTLADAAPVAATELEARFMVQGRRALAQHVEQRLIGHVRIHGRGAIADQAREVMRIPGRAGLDDDVALAAQAFFDEAVMDGSRREQRVDRDQVLLEIPVGQQQDELACADSSLGLVAHGKNCVLERQRLSVLQVDELVRDALALHRDQLPELALRQHG